MLSRMGIRQKLAEISEEAKLNSAEFDRISVLAKAGCLIQLRLHKISRLPSKFDRVPLFRASRINNSAK